MKLLKACALVIGLTLSTSAFAELRGDLPKGENCQNKPNNSMVNASPETLKNKAASALGLRTQQQENNKQKVETKTTGNT